ncbi:MAG: transketolase [Anaerovoracaceae bacterium]|jgi:transketolase
MENKELEEIARRVRITLIKAIHAAGSGHPGGSLSCADILTALYFQVMHIDPDHPQMENRDKLVLSKGHAAPALYAVLAERGYFPKEDVLTLRKIGSRFQGHPNMRLVPGVEMSTGSLGQGLSAANGMALANRLNGSDARVYVILGDGEIQEGMVWEAAMSAAHYRLDHVTAFLDWNGLQIDGRNEDVMTVTPVDRKFAAFGWNVLSCDGHDMASILGAVEQAHACSGQPTMIIARTQKGRGVSFMEDAVGWHGKAPNDEQYATAMKELGGEL